MFEGYLKVAGIEEGRRAVALDCVIRLQGEREGTLARKDADFVIKQLIERAKVFESYLVGKESS